MDRRTEYTIHVVKEAFLKLLSEKEYMRITIADICREAEIHRSTFYLHFDRKEDVLDALLNEAFAEIANTLEHLSHKTDVDCKMPLCVFIRENSKYQPIFKDASLENYVVGKIAKEYMDDYVMELCRKSYYSKEEAETVFWFNIHGCYALAVHNMHLSAHMWEQKKRALDRFILRGSGQ